MTWISPDDSELLNDLPIYICSSPLNPLPPMVMVPLLWCGVGRFGFSRSSTTTSILASRSSSSSSSGSSSDSSTSTRGRGVAVRSHIKN